MQSSNKYMCIYISYFVVSSDETYFVKVKFIFVRKSKEALFVGVWINTSQAFMFIDSDSHK